ncbi:hypothetical protein EUGRSUZ_B01066 [Eucalyptus grandis]|uniref:Uncharacterized protein n=2 Tax=Eucalyptus grandis TaxID=71139 RepID=A0ACC3LPD0_EUCGR|nr:hypothetical protein EUGRSUZ_B01066 [Eucalyptus grandis]
MKIQEWMLENVYSRKSPAKTLLGTDRYKSIDKVRGAFRASSRMFEDLTALFENPPLCDTATNQTLLKKAKGSNEKQSENRQRERARIAKERDAYRFSSLVAATKEEERCRDCVFSGERCEEEEKEEKQTSRERKVRDKKTSAKKF